MAVKNFMSNYPGWIQLSHIDSYGGQDLKVDAGYEMQEFIIWWREWKEVMKNPHPSVWDAIQQVKVVHELSKEQGGQPKTYTWNQTSV
jgi:hypothetical protein